MTARVLFICHGNICRSPMLERVFTDYAAVEGVDVVVTSAGVSDEEHGRPIDRRARLVLEAAGHDASGHRAHRVTSAEIMDADLVIAAETSHLVRLRRIAPEADHLALISDFIPGAEPGSPMPDPWYGDLDDFHDTLASADAAMPALLTAVRQLG